MPLSAPWRESVWPFALDHLERGEVERVEDAGQLLPLKIIRYAAVVRLPDVAQRMADQGQTPIVNTPEEFARAYQADYPKWESLVKASGAKPE